MKNGILPVELAEETVEQILLQVMKFEDYKIMVDVPQQIVVLPGGAKFDFEIDPYRKECLMNGMDDLDYLLSHEKEIGKFEKRRAKNLFFKVEKC